MRIVPLVLILLLTGCRGEDVRLLEQKADAPLRQRLEQLEAQQRDEPIAIFGKCTAPVDDAMKKRMAKAGAEAQAVMGDVFAARILASRVVKLAQLDFITQLSLSQISSPLGP